LRSLVSGPRPAGANQEAYDYSVSAFGSAAAAKTAVETAIVDTMATLRASVDNDSAAGNTEFFGGKDAQMKSVLEAWRAGIDSNQSDAGLLPAANNINRLLGRMAGAESTPVPKNKDTIATAGAFPMIEMPMYDLGTLHLLTGSDTRQVVLLDAQTTPTLNVLFGGAGNAQSAMNMLANAYATMENFPGDASKQSTAAKYLYDALSKIPSRSDMWNNSTHPEFAAAMQALARGDLRSGLDHLSKETGFNAMYDSMDNLHVVSISQKAVARLRAGLTLRFPESINQQAFDEYRTLGVSRVYPWQVLHWDMGFNYVNLLLSGMEQTMRLDLQSNRMVATGSPRPIEGSGNAAEFRPAITWGGSMLGYPVESTLHGTAGYMWWKIQSQYTANGNTQDISAESSNPYFGLGFETRFLGFTANRAGPKFSRAGLGVFNLNPYAYLTAAQIWPESNKWRMETSITPQYLMFWGKRMEGFEEKTFYQHHIGADLRPLDSYHQSGPRWMLAFGPGLRYDWNTEQGVHTFEPYAHGSFMYDGGVALSLRGGYFTETGGDPWARVPSTPFASLNLMLTPAKW
jgi:hypothetical protein